jgi:bilirubin oxidase
LQGRKDVVLVPGAQGTARFIAEFTDFADPIWPYMYHCHMLTHEDMGMMGQFIVVDTTVSVQELSSGFPVSVYPNPVSGGQITASSPNLKGQLVVWNVYDIAGRLISGATTAADSDGRIMIESVFAEGIYALTLQDMHGNTAVVRIVRQ